MQSSSVLCPHTGKDRLDNKHTIIKLFFILLWFRHRIEIKWYAKTNDILIINELQKKS